MRRMQQQWDRMVMPHDMYAPQPPPWDSVTTHSALEAENASLRAMVADLSRRPTVEQWRQLMASAARTQPIELASLSDKEFAALFGSTDLSIVAVPDARIMAETPIVAMSDAPSGTCQHCGTFIGVAVSQHERYCDLAPQPEPVALVLHDPDKGDACTCQTCVELREVVTW